MVMDSKLLLIGVVLASVGAAAPAAAQSDVVSYVLEYSGTSLSGRIDYTYDVEGRVTEKLTTRPNAETGGMENDERVNYYYDEQGRQNVVENYLWDDNLQAWYGNNSDDNNKLVTTFNDEGRPAEIFYYDWGSNNWAADWTYHGVFVYDGNTAKETRSKQKNGIPMSNGTTYIDYTYDDNLRVVEKIKSMEYFDIIPTDRWTYEYDDHGNITIESQYMYKESGGDDPWDPWGGYSTSAKPLADDSDNWALMYSYKYEYEYDSNGNITRKKRWDYDDVDGDYTTLTYDLTYEYYYGSNDALELPYFNDFNAADALNGFDTEDGNNDGSTWTLADGVVTCTSELSSEGPEILYLPSIRFSTDYEVMISFKARVTDAEKPGNVALILCDNDQARAPMGQIGQTWQITSTEYVEVVGLLVPPKDSPYTIGICFDNAQVGSTVVIDDIEVKNYRSSDTPNAPYSFVAEPAIDGSLQVRLTWYPPTQTVGGDFITTDAGYSIDNMVLYRDGIEEPLYETGRTGTSLAAQYTDTQFPGPGEYTYRVYAVVNGLRSDASVVTVKVGYPVPQAIKGLSVVENADHTVTVSWDAPAEEDGNVKYYIVRNNETLLAEAFEGTSFVDNTIDTSMGQVYCYYYIQPFNEVGYGQGVTSDALFVGESTQAPFKESFAGGYATHQWLLDKVKGYDAGWGYAASYGNIVPQDEDGGMAVFQSSKLAEGDIIRLAGEKIDLSSTAAPEVSFYMYHLAGDITGDVLLIEASKDNGEFSIISEPINVSGYAEEGWAQHIVALDGFAGEKNVRIALRGVSGITHDIAVDNIVVGEKGSSSVDETFADGSVVYADGGNIIVRTTTDSDIKVYAINGTQIFASNGKYASIPVMQGIYVVTINGHAVKVMVK